MKKSIANKWIKALKSGEYNQTTDYLKQDTGFCALGVLCDLAVKEGIIPEPKKVFECDGITEMYSFLGSVATPPSKVLTWAGLNTDKGEFSEGLQRISISQLNDEGYTFLDIADKIKEHKEQL